MCSVVRDNQSNSYYLLRAGGGVHRYEDVLETNIGPFFAEGDPDDLVLERVPVGSCRQLVLSDLPVAEAVPEPRPGLAALAWLCGLAGLRRRRMRGRRSGPVDRA